MCRSQRRRRRAGGLLEVMNGCQAEGAPHVLHVTEEQAFPLTSGRLFRSTLERFKGAFLFQKAPEDAFLHRYRHQAPPHGLLRAFPLPSIPRPVEFRRRRRGPTAAGRFQMLQMLGALPSSLG